MANDSGKHPGGRHQCQCLDHIYAREVGANVRLVRLLGGAAKLRALPEDARTILLKPRSWSPKGTINIQKKYKGGLKALGMHSRQAEALRKTNNG